MSVNILVSVVTDRGNVPQGSMSHNLVSHQGGTYASLQEKLGFWAELGATQLHISCPFAAADALVDRNTGLMATGYHGFWPKDFRTLEPRFGSEADLRAFIEAAGLLGMEIIGEMTFHVGEGAEQALPSTWVLQDKSKWCMGFLPRLDLDTPAVMQYVCATLTNLKDLGFAGVRLDTAFELSPQHLATIVSAGQAAGLSLIGEVFSGDPAALEALDDRVVWTDYPLNYALFSVLAKREAGLEQLHKLLIHPYGASPQQLQTFVDNHDVASFCKEVTRGGAQPISIARERMAMALSLVFVVRGNPAVYYLDPWALALEGMADPLGTNRLAAPWDQEPTLESLIQNLVALRKARPELSIGAYRELWLPGDAQLWVFAKSLNGYKTVVILNNEDYGINLADIGLNCQGRLPDGDHTCLLRPGKSFSIEGGRVSGTLAPRSIYLLGN